MSAADAAPAAPAATAAASPPSAWELASVVPAVYDLVRSFEHTAHPDLQTQVLEMLAEQRRLEEVTRTWDNAHLKIPKRFFHPFLVCVYEADGTIEVANGRAKLPLDTVAEDTPASKWGCRHLAVSFERLGISMEMMNTLLYLLQNKEAFHATLDKKELDEVLVYIEQLSSHVLQMLHLVKHLHKVSPLSIEHDEKKARKILQKAKREAEREAKREAEREAKEAKKAKVLAAAIQAVNQYLATLKA